MCSPLWPVDADMHRMPLRTSRQQFDSLPHEGHFPGLRPDQVRVFHELQPYQAGDTNRDYIGRTMTHLAESLAAVERGDPLVCAWATNFEPEFQLPDGARVDSLTVEPGGRLAPGMIFARFRVTPADAAAAVRVRRMPPSI